MTKLLMQNSKKRPMTKSEDLKKSESEETPSDSNSKEILVIQKDLYYAS